MIWARYSLLLTFAVLVAASLPTVAQVWAQYIAADSFSTIGIQLLHLAVLILIALVFIVVSVACIQYPFGNWQATWDKILWRSVTLLWCIGVIGFFEWLLAAWLNFKPITSTNLPLTVLLLLFVTTVVTLKDKLYKRWPRFFGQSLDHGK